MHLDSALYSTHSMRRTKPYLICKRQKLESIPAFIGPKKLESTVRYLGVKVDDALEMPESIEI